jgi:hypothetical protein
LGILGHAVWVFFDEHRVRQLHRNEHDAQAAR